MLQPDQRNQIEWISATHEEHQLQLLELWKRRGGMLERGEAKPDEEETCDPPRN